METIDLRDYFGRLLKNWVIIALCCVIGVSFAFIYSEFFATPQYSSSIKMSVANDDWSQSVTISDLQTTSKIIENCIVVLEDDVMAEMISETVEAETGDVYTVKEIKKALSFSHIGDSGFIKITATTDDPELSALLCNVISAKAPDLIIDSIANVQMKTLGDGAKVNYNPVSPNTLKNMIIGFVIMLVIAAGAIFAVMYFDKTIHDESVFTEKYQIAVLGVIPNNDSVKVSD